MRARLPIVGVMGSGTHEHQERATALGVWLASRPVHLLTGGGGGVMASVSRAFHETPDRVGSVIGVLPGNDAGARPDGYPNPWVEIVVATHLPLSGERGTDPMSRNHINVLSADLVIALPGGSGTASEVRLARRYRRRVVAHVANATDIPGLDAEVPIAATLAELRPHLDAVLADE